MNPSTSTACDKSETLRKIKSLPRLHKRILEHRKEVINSRIYDLMQKKNALRKGLKNPPKFVTVKDIKTMELKIKNQCEMVASLKRRYELQVRRKHEFSMMKEAMKKYNITLAVNVDDDQLMRDLERQLSDDIKAINGATMYSDALQAELNKIMETATSAYNSLAEDAKNICKYVCEAEDCECEPQLYTYSRSKRQCIVCTETKYESEFTWSNDCPHSICISCITQNRSVNKRCVVCRVEQSDTFIVLDTESSIMRFKNVLIEGSTRNQLEDEYFEFEADESVETAVVADE